MFLRSWMAILATLTLLANDVTAQAQSTAPAESANTPSQVGISPPMFEISLDEPLATHAYRLHNLGGHDTRVRVRVANWTLGENDEMVLLPPDEQSLDRWLVVNPLEFDLPAGATQAVRFSARPARALAPGEYRAVLVFEEQPIDTASAGDGTMSLTARFRIFSAIYASTGVVDRGALIDSVALHGDRLELSATGTGDGHARAEARYRILASGTGKVLAEGEIARVPVLPGHTRRVATTLPEGVHLPAGRYQVEIDGQLGDSPVALRRDLVVSD